MKNLQHLQHKIFNLIFFMILLSLFSGCSAIEEKQSELDLESVVKTVQERSAYFTLERAENNMVLLVLHNPKKENIQSFSSEIIFPPHLIQVKNLTNLSKNIFELHMKSDWNINSHNGIISVASAVLGKAKNIPEKIKIAHITFKKIEKNSSFRFDINENISNIFIVENSKSTILKSIVNKTLIKDLIIK